MIKYTGYCEVSCSVVVARTLSYCLKALVIVIFSAAAAETTSLTMFYDCVHGTYTLSLCCNALNGFLTLIGACDMLMFNVSEISQRS